MFTTKPASDTPDNVLQTISEISQRMARAYRDKARDDVENRRDEAEYFAAHGDRKGANYERKMMRKRRDGIDTATKKIHKSKRVAVPVSEEPEQIEELSKGTLSSYLEKAAVKKKEASDKHVETMQKHFTAKDGSNHPEIKKSLKRAVNKNIGVMRAKQRLTEDLTRNTRGKYFRKDMSGIGNDPKAKMVERYTNADNENFELYKNSNDVFELRDSKRQVLQSWHTDNKEVRQKTLVRYGLEPAPVHELDEEVLVLEAPRVTRASIEKGIKDGTWEAMHDIKDRQHVELRHTETGKRKTVFVEEIEQIDEVSKKTLSSYIEKASRSAARESEKGGRRDHQSVSVPDRETSRYASDKADDHFDKSEKRLKGVVRAVKKLTEGEENSFKRLVGTKSLLKTFLDDTPGQEDGSEPKAVNEQPEQIDELSPPTLGRYVKSAMADKERRKNNAEQYAKIGHDQIKKDGDYEGAQKNFRKAGEDAHKKMRRSKGIYRAIDKLVK